MTELIQALTETLPFGSLIVVVPPQGGEVPDLAQSRPMPGRSSDAAVAQARLNAGDEPLPLSQWGRELSGIPTRELERAHKEGALKTQIRKQGLGHGAIEATPSAVLRYLQTCAAVQQGTMSVPSWWPKVRKGRNGGHHG